MSNIDKLEEKLAKLKTSASLSALLPKGSNWLSKKLLSMLAVVAGLIWLGRDNLSLVISSITLLAAIYIIVQGVNDAVHSLCDAWTRRAIIQGMAVDGISAAERKALGVKTEVITEGESQNAMSTARIRHPGHRPFSLLAAVVVIPDSTVGRHRAEHEDPAFTGGVFR